VTREFWNHTMMAPNATVMKMEPPMPQIARLNSS